MKTPAISNRNTPVPRRYGAPRQKLGDQEKRDRNQRSEPGEKLGWLRLAVVIRGMFLYFEFVTLFHYGLIYFNHFCLQLVNWSSSSHSFDLCCAQRPQRCPSDEDHKAQQYPGPQAAPRRKGDYRRAITGLARVPQPRRPGGEATADGPGVVGRRATTHQCTQDGDGPPT